MNICGVRGGDRGVGWGGGAGGAEVHPCNLPLDPTL